MGFHLFHYTLHWSRKVSCPLVVLIWVSIRRLSLFSVLGFSMHDLHWRNLQFFLSSLSDSGKTERYGENEGKYCRQNRTLSLASFGNPNTFASLPLTQKNEQCLQQSPTHCHIRWLQDKCTNKYCIYINHAHTLTSSTCSSFRNSRFIKKKTYLHQLIVTCVPSTMV